LLKHEISAHRRRFALKKILLVSLILSLAACGAGERDQAHLPMEADRTLTVADTIGVEMGEDAYTFGAIQKLSYDAEGNILVLDIAMCRLQVYDGTGVWLRTIGGPGDGPGEMGYPSDMTVLSDGRIAVNDPMRSGILIYSPEGEYLDVIEGFYMTPFQYMHPSPEGGFTARRSASDMDGDQAILRNTVARWTDSGDQATVYWEDTAPFDFSDLTSFLRHSIYSLSVTADADGRVFVAPMSTSDYSILCYEADGTLFNTVTMSLPRVLRTEEEKLGEKEFVESRMQSMGAHDIAVRWVPDDYRQMITSMGVDRMQNLWVRRGTEPHPVFDVFETSSGDLLYSAVMEDGIDASSWRFFISPGGILAFPENTLESPRVFVIEVSEETGEHSG
jgi:hypothetical protein